MYSFSTQLAGDFNDIEQQVIAALQKEGFGVLTEINVQATLKKKMDLDMRPYKILGACNPPLAHQAIEAEPDIGLLLPCNVLLREEDDGKTSIAFMDPDAVMGFVNNEAVTDVAKEAKTRLLRVRDALEEGAQG